MYLKRGSFEKVKSAHDDVFTCLMFNQYLNEFIDDDLDEEIKRHFLSHAIVCKECNSNLKELKSLKNVLGNLTPVSVSSDFDNKLKDLIFLETARLKNPLYRFKLYINENIKGFLIIPAAALIIFGIFYSRTDMHFNQRIRPEITQNQVLTTDSIIISSSEDYSEEIHYVLDKVKPSEVETGIFLNEHDTPIQTTSTVSNFSLTSF